MLKNSQITNKNRLFSDITGCYLKIAGCRWIKENNRLLFSVTGIDDQGLDSQKWNQFITKGKYLPLKWYGVFGGFRGSFSFSFSFPSLFCLLNSDFRMAVEGRLPLPKKALVGLSCSSNLIPFSPTKTEQKTFQNSPR